MTQNWPNGSETTWSKKHLPGYCYVDAEGFGAPADFSFWVETCLAFNSEAKPSKKSAGN